MPVQVLRLLYAARQPVDGASLAVLRIALGALIMYDAVRKGTRFFDPNEGLDFRLPYDGFEWVPMPTGHGDLLAGIFFLTGLLVSLGLFYRPAIVAALGLTIFGFLQAQEHYLNHYYLLILLIFLMALVPAHQVWSLDRLVFPERMGKAVANKLHLWLLKGQIEIVLLFAGFVKINADWLQLEPLRSWLRQGQDRVLFGAIYNYDWAVAVAAYGVIALHIIGAPLLLWKRTRLAVFLVYSSFHVLNHNMFDIGIFPWMTIAMTTLFFDPDWPRRLLGLAKLPQLALASPSPMRPSPAYATAAFGVFAALWLTSQALIPLRHYTLQGDVAWTYEGHQFSWRMKLVDRWSPGLVALAHLPEQNKLIVPPMHRLMTGKQYDAVSTRPRMAHAVAPKLAGQISTRYGARVRALHYYAPVGYNNREASLIIKPEADMLRQPIGALHAPWLIRSTDKPLRRIEDFSNKYTYPKMADIARMAGLPEVKACHWEKESWYECDLQPRQQMADMRR